MDKELSYWLALTHISSYRTKKKNELIVKLFHEGKTIKDFFHLSESEWINDYNIDPKFVALFADAKNKLSNYAFLAEDLIEQGYNIIPITSKDYSPLLKKNLKTSAPTIIYTKGNLQLLKEDSIAIVGSRKANNNSLDFTDCIAKKATEEYKVVVSGFAKGVDRQALESALKYKGQSIIVLPQGITTFNTGFKKYYQQIIEGDVLVLSTFYPKAPWSVQLAMSRNSIIYGLASEIYVAESSNKGGTWSGVQDGLKKGRNIYIRMPRSKENNANHLLISEGGIAVDKNGKLISDKQLKDDVVEIRVSEQVSKYNNAEEKIIELTKKGIFSAKEISNILNIEWSSQKISNFLRKREDIKTIKGSPLTFTYKDSQSQSNLFD
ncbi:MAG TPA: DNA-processing protein DprA [Chitinophagaceae bacterium]|nr:DNA-processing protein DprA [Chitinophagaceae bacterium]